jgi:flagellar hook-basal body complex protein FliE
MSIPPLSAATPATALTGAQTIPETGSGFGDTLKRVLATVDGSAGTANEAVSGMIDGTGDVHQAMIALQRAEMTLQLTVQIRNKLVAAYQDVMRMPI